MYRYTGCGLLSVYLLNGFKKMKTRYGNAVSIENVEGLHKAIGTHLIFRNAELSGAEFRFLRKEMNMSQKTFGDFVGLQGQSIANWEKKSKVPKGHGLFIRFLYQENIIHGKVEITKTIERLNEMDQKRIKKIVFEETAEGWIPSAA